jgi:hypothetical protein
MNWLRISEDRSRAYDDRQVVIATAFRTGSGWIGSAAGQQSQLMDDESAAREWCEVALEANAKAA